MDQVDAGGVRDHQTGCCARPEEGDERVVRYSSIPGNRYSFSRRSMRQRLSAAEADSGLVARSVSGRQDHGGRSGNSAGTLSSAWDGRRNERGLPAGSRSEGEAFRGLQPRGCRCHRGDAGKGEHRREGARSRPRRFQVPELPRRSWFGPAYRSDRCRCSRRSGVAQRVQRTRRRSYGAPARRGTARWSGGESAPGRVTSVGPKSETPGQRSRQDRLPTSM